MRSGNNNGQRQGSRLGLALVVWALIAALLALASSPAASQAPDPERPAPTPNENALDGPTEVDGGGRPVTPSLSADTAAGGGAFYAQFAQPLTGAEFDTLGSAGVTFAQALPPSTYVIHAAPGSDDALGSVAGFIGLEPYVALDKLTPALRAQQVPQHAVTEGIVQGEAAFFADVALAGALAAADAAGVVVPDRGSYLVDNRLAIEGSQVALEVLAEDDRVFAVSEAPEPAVPEDITQQQLHNVDDVHTAGRTGTGVNVALWEAGANANVAVHGEIDPRVNRNSATGNSNHATSVAGIMVGNGSIQATAEGMAPTATIESYDLLGDEFTQMTNAANNDGVIASNHSYGAGDFGNYNTSTRSMDVVAVNTNLVPVKSAGNSGPGFDTLTSPGTAKNMFTVGSVEDNGTTISGFSSRGPADDGRIKPDIVANGSGVFAPAATALHLTGSGTSFAAPVVTGTLALLEEHYRATRGGGDMPQDTARAVLVNTALDRGLPGADYTFGHGLLDAQAALGQLGAANTFNGAVANGGVNNRAITVAPGTPELSVTLNWVDQPGVANSAANDIVNNLDLELVAPNGTTIHYPWTGPGTGNPGGNATNAGPNAIDTVERVQVTNPTAGQWTVRVTGTNVPMPVAGTQTYALVTSSPWVAGCVNNDTFVCASVLAGPPAMVTGDNTGFGVEGGEPSASCAFGGDPSQSTAWWNWTSPVTGNVTLDTEGSTVLTDTQLAVYTGTAVNALTEVACDEDSGTNLLSSVTFAATSGTTYRIQVDGWNSMTGAFNLNLAGPPGGATCNGLAVDVDLNMGQVPTVNADVILGTPGPDVIVALGGNDTICGQGGNDTINAGPGNDWVDGNLGNDTVFGQDGDDTIMGGQGADQLLGFGDNDTIDGGVGNDTINGGPGNDNLSGGDQNDQLYAQGGNDTVSGGNGDDFIIG
ncbi:MAG: S8 family serine peptidase, partial [Acidimicrobiales bacterium]